MRKELFSALPRWLFAFCVCVCALSILAWRSGAPLHTAALAALCALYLTGLLACERTWGWVGAAVIALTAAVLPPLLWGRAAFAADLAALRGGTGGSGNLAASSALALLGLAAAILLRRYEARYLLSLCWCAFWLAAAVLEVPVPRLALGAMMPLLLFTLCETVHTVLRRRGRFDAIAPVLALILSFSALVGVMPASDEPYGYPLTHALIERVEQLYRSAQTHLFYRVQGKEQFSMGFNGFSETAQTGESAENESGQSFTVEAVRDPEGAVYLAGNTWDTFRDGSWYDTVDAIAGGLLDWKIDTAEHLYALWRWQQAYPWADRETICRENGYIVRYEGMNTQTVFTADNTLRINADLAVYPFRAHAGRVLFDYVQKRDAVYAVGYLEPQARWERLIRFAEGYDYDDTDKLEWEEVGRGLPGIAFAMDGAVSVEPMLARREALIRGAYLAVPKGTSAEVLALAEEITAPFDTDYDKLTAIAAYLRQNYRYTTTPQAVPEGMSLLDHLLFGAREGYCTWYATAATVLARAAGIPARYVQGARTVLHADERTPVTGADSHAWCEGYIRGFGWVTVEATPGFDGSDGAQSTVPEPFEVLTPTHRPMRPHPHALIETPPEEETEPVEPIVIPPEEEPENPDGLLPGGEASPEPEPPEETERKRGVRLAPILALPLLALGAYLAVRWRREKTRRAYERLTFSERTLEDLKGVLGDLSKRGYTRDVHDSLSQHFAKVRWRNLSIDEKEAMGMARLYEEILFGTRELTEEEWARERRFADSLRPSRFDLRAFLRQYI